MTDRPSKYEVLKELLMGDEMKKQSSIEERLQALDQELKVKEKLERHMEPVLTERFLQFKRDFPEEYRLLIVQGLRKQMEDDPQEVKQLLAPLVLEIIQGYFRQRWQTFKAFFGFGVRPKKDPMALYTDQEVYLENDRSQAQLSDVFVIENKHFSLVGHRSIFKGNKDEYVEDLLRQTVADKVADAVNSTRQAIHWTEFDTYKMYLITFKRLSVVCVVSGKPSEQFKTQLEDQVMDFAKDLLPEYDAQDEEYSLQVTNRFLFNHFEAI